MNFGPKGEFYAAIEADSLEKLEEAISIGADVNYVSNKKLPGWVANFYGNRGSGNSALHLACWKGLSKQIIDRLLEVGADVHLKSEGDGHTALHTACYSGKVELITLLLDLGCGPNETNNSNQSPLHWSARCGANNCVKLLLDKGANVHVKTDLGNIPLVSAAAAGKLEAVELLIDQGSDVNSMNIEKGNALFSALYFNHKEVVQLLLSRGVSFFDKNSSNHTPRILALYRDNQEIAVILQRWPVSMAILLLQELFVYNQIDCFSFEELFNFIGLETDWAHYN